MRQLLVLVLALGFFHINVLKSNADDFDKYEEQASRKKMTCLNEFNDAVGTTLGWMEHKFSTDGTSLWYKYEDSLVSFPTVKVVVGAKITGDTILSVKKKPGEEKWIWEVDGDEFFIDFERRVYVRNDLSSEWSSELNCF